MTPTSVPTLKVGYTASDPALLGPGAADFTSQTSLTAAPLSLTRRVPCAWSFSSSAFGTSGEFSGPTGSVLYAPCPQATALPKSRNAAIAFIGPLTRLLMSKVRFIAALPLSAVAAVCDRRSALIQRRYNLVAPL